MRLPPRFYITPYILGLAAMLAEHCWGIGLTLTTACVLVLLVSATGEDLIVLQDDGEVDYIIH